MQQEILDIYSKTFARPEVIYKKLNKKYTLKQIKDVLKNIDTNQIIGKKQENKDLEIPISAPAGSFQADLTFYEQFKRQNHGYSTILTVIEMNTRFAYAYPLKNKKAESILKCLQDLHSKEKSNLQSISFDAGSEFENKIVKNYLDKNNIKYIFFNKQTNPNSTMMIERFNRTLRDKISKYQSFKKQKNYVDELQNLVNEYNNTEHTSIKMTPKQAKEQHFTDSQARGQKIDLIYKIDQQFKVGDFVRVLRDKKLFEKGQKNYTKNIYKIVDKKDNNFILRKFKDGKLLDKQLVKTAAYLMKVNIFDLIENKKQKREVSKKEVKQITNLEKKMKREGINLLNIMEYEKFLDDNNIPNIEPEQKQPKIDKFVVAEQLDAHRKINQARQQNEKLENKLILQKSKSQEDLQKYKQQLDEQDEELLKLEEEKQKLQQEKSILQEQSQKDSQNVKIGLQVKINQLKQQKNKINSDKQEILKYNSITSAKGRKQFMSNLRLNSNINALDKNQIDFINKQEFQLDFRKKLNDEAKIKEIIKKMTDYCDQQNQQIDKEIKKMEQEHQIKNEDSQQESEEEKEVDEQPDFGKISDTEHFKKYELKNYNTESEINQKIKELQEAIDLMEDDDDIEMLSRVSEYNAMIRLLKDKKQKRNKKNKSIQSGGDDDQDESQSGSLFKMFKNFGKN